MVVLLAGLLVGAAGVVGRWLAYDLSWRSVPPGLVILTVAAGLVALVRRRSAVAIGTTLGGVVLLQLVTNVTSRVLLGGAGAGAAAMVWLELVGVVTAVIAGVAALVLDRPARGVDRRQHGWGRWAQVAGLLVLAPVCAEYLAAYDDSTGHPLTLLGHLVIFVPLYGCPALLIREVARRSGLGWLGIVALAAAFGLLQAGVVDQSLFSTDYRQIEGWQEGYRATLIAPLGISAFNAVNFVGGHVIYSICAPIALVEAARPRSAQHNWLGSAGLAVTAVAYVAASTLVLRMHLSTESSHASTAQLSVSLVLIAAVILLAYGQARRHRSTDPRPAPRLRTVAALALLVSTAAGMAEETWTGVGLTVGAYLVAALGIGWASRRTGWGVREVAVVAAAPLLVRAVLAFTYDPLVGEVSELAKYSHNAVMLVVVLFVAGLSLRPPAGVEARVPSGV